MQSSETLFYHTLFDHNLGSCSLKKTSLYGVLHSVNSSPLNIYLSPPPPTHSKVPSFIRNIMCQPHPPPSAPSSPLFLEQKFQFLYLLTSFITFIKHWKLQIFRNASLTFWRDDITCENILKHTIIKYITYTSHCPQAI